VFLHGGGYVRVPEQLSPDMFATRQLETVDASAVSQEGPGRATIRESTPEDYGDDENENGSETVSDR